MNPSQPVSPRRRMQELLAIPDNQRTEAQWDELNELEIKLAPGNREPSSESGASRDGPPPQQGRQNQRNNNNNNNTNNNNNPAGKRPARKFHKRSPKPPTNNTP